jgi:hypothetical protein
MKKLVFIFLLFFVPFSWSQYPPAAGQAGSTAIKYDSSCFVGWASHVAITRGYININDTTAQYNGTNRASFGLPEDATGPATAISTDAVSLGDSGLAIVTFVQPIYNGLGADFAIFENGLSDNFLELGLVEVSSDGEHFVRFPSSSLSQTASQINSFGSVDPTKINNLAGKYRVGYGTPFDLEELKDSSGIDIDNITHIKIIDAIGSIGTHFTQDNTGNKINELFPTPFNTGGFDLNGVGVMYQKLAGLTEKQFSEANIFPNPASNKLIINNLPFNSEIQLLTIGGKVLKNKYINSANAIEWSLDFVPGIYFVRIISEKQNVVQKIIIE